MAQAKNITWHHGEITPDQRAALLGQRGGVVWLTGLSGSGKSTLARLLEQRLHAAGRACYVLDGDNVRHGLNADLGFSAADRQENIRRIGHVAALMADAGLIVLTAFISPFRADRELARRAAGERPFLEVFLATPLSACEERDPKGLYKKARAGEIAEFTGLDSPYEPPLKPELTIDTAAATPDNCVEALFERLASTLFVSTDTRDTRNTRGPSGRQSGENCTR